MAAQRETSPPRWRQFVWRWWHECSRDHRRIARPASRFSFASASDSDAVGQNALGLQDAVRHLASHLRSHPRVDLADVCLHAAVGRQMFNRRVAVSASSVEEAIAALEDPKQIRTGVVDDAGADVALIFPGQGSQYPGMAQDLYEREPRFREEIDRCVELLKPELGRDLRESCSQRPKRPTMPPPNCNRPPSPSRLCLPSSMLWRVRG